MKTRNSKEGKKWTSATPSVLLIFSLLLFTNAPAKSHCDTMDGPVIRDASKALDRNNPAFVLKWVRKADESELSEAFRLTMKVRTLGPDARALADKYFFETLVRLHRSGEGVPYTGLKPSGTPVDEKILAADTSIETGNLNPLIGKVSEEQMPELKERFEKVIALKNYNVNDVEAGREYVEAYVRFFKYAEGEDSHSHDDAQQKTHLH